LIAEGDGVRLGVIRWVIVAVVSAVLFSGGSAWASTISTPLGQTSFGAIVVDNANSYVFVSSPGGNDVHVYNFSGTLLTTISGITGADGMVINGSTLYVAENTSNGSIEKISLSNFTDEGALATGLVNPQWLVFAGDQLWTNTNPTDASSQLTSVSMSGDVDVFPYSTPGAGLGETNLATTPNDTDLLYVVDDAGDIDKLNEHSGSPVIDASLPSDEAPNTSSGLAVSADGTRLITGPQRSGYVELNASTLVADGLDYVAADVLDDAGDTAFAVSSGSGSLLATVAAQTSSSITAVNVFQLGSTTASYTTGLSDPRMNPEFVPNSLALSADGTKLFGVGETNGAGSSLRLWTFNLGSPGAAVGIAVSGAVGTTSSDPVTLTATTSADGGGSVTFYYVGSNGTDTPISNCSAVPLTNGSGPEQAVCTTTSLPSGTTSLILAYYSGDASDAGASTYTYVSTLGADFTWAGGGSDSNWSTGLNWVGGNALTETVGTLTFPNLGSSCNSGASSDACYMTQNDSTGLPVYGIDVDSDHAYHLMGNQIDLGSGGITISGTTSQSAPPTFGLPIDLTGGQTWTVSEGPVRFSRGISGGEALALDASNGSLVAPDGGMEVGPVSASGDGGFYLDGSTSINESSGSSIDVSDGGGLEADQTNNTISGLDVDTGGWLSIGEQDNGPGELYSEQSVSFADGSSTLDVGVDAPGDYSELGAFGHVTLNGAALHVDQEADSDGYCYDLEVGDVLTLINASSGVFGTFSNYPDGASVDIANDCDPTTDGTQIDSSGTIHYTPNSVTLTITDSGNAAGGPAELVAPTLSDSIPADNGSTREGRTLTVNPGQWLGATSYSYTWYECDPSDPTNCAQIPDASAQTFVPTSDELGLDVFADVTVTAADGETTYDYTSELLVNAEPVPASTAAPAISGITTVGAALGAATGSWSNAPTSYAYQWERCSSTGTSCTSITAATTATYTTTSADLGSTLKVSVIATNYGGTGTAATSAASAIIAAVPSTQGTSNTTTPPATTTSVSAVQTALKAVAKPVGKDASKKELLKLKGYTFSFKAPSQGTLTVVWTATVKHKTVTIGRGHASVAKGATAKVKVTLTSQGKTDLKRHPGLKVKTESTFTTAGLSPTSSSSTFTA
jgi:hypothetical protein